MMSCAERSRSSRSSRIVPRNPELGGPPNPMIANVDFTPSVFSTIAIIGFGRSEEHTSELQSRLHLVCRLLLEKKKDVRRDAREGRVGRAEWKLSNVREHCGTLRHAGRLRGRHSCTSCATRPVSLTTRDDDWSVFIMMLRPPKSTLFPYTTLFR